jgi:hypothetical protein
MAELESLLSEYTAVPIELDAEPDSDDDDDDDEGDWVLPRSEADIFTDIISWFQCSDGEDALNAFEQCVRSKTFHPVDLWHLLTALHQCVDRRHLAALKHIHKALAVLRDEDPPPPRSLAVINRFQGELGYIHILLGFESVLEHKGMASRRIDELREANWPHYARSLITLKLPAGGGLWRIERPSGSPGLGKRS